MTDLFFFGIYLSFDVNSVSCEVLDSLRELETFGAWWQKDYRALASDICAMKAELQLIRNEGLRSATRTTTVPPNPTLPTIS